jgi:CheY-like chemotaxis protein
MTRRASLLVVDDHELNRDELSRRLQHKGYDVMLAVDACKALELVARRDFHLILLDVEMPGMSGLGRGCPTCTEF